MCLSVCSGNLWCADCGSLARPACAELSGHTVLGLRSALQLHVQQVQEVCESTKDLLRQLGTDQQVLAALQVFARPAESCQLVLMERGGEPSLSATWQLQDTLREKVLRMLVLVLALDDGRRRQVRTLKGSRVKRPFSSGGK